MTQNDDPYCLAIMKPYRNLVPMAEERRKPIFKLTSADGAIGSHAGEKFSAAFNNTGSWHQVFYFVIPRVSRGIQPLRD